MKKAMIVFLVFRIFVVLMLCYTIGFVWMTDKTFLYKSVSSIFVTGAATYFIIETLKVKNTYK